LPPLGGETVKKRLSRLPRLPSASSFRAFHAFRVFFAFLALFFSFVVLTPNFASSASPTPSPSPSPSLAPSYFNFVPPTPAEGSVVNQNSVTVKVETDAPLFASLLAWVFGSNFDWYLMEQSGNNFQITVSGLGNGLHCIEATGLFADENIEPLSSGQRCFTVNA
jgi:hypothetical protein